MALDRFMIAPYNSGLINAIKPWLIPDEAFVALYNAYVWRGRVKKRFGARPINTDVAQNIQQLYTRLRIEIPNSTTSMAGTVGIAPLLFIPDGGVVTTGYVGAIGQMFSCGPDIFTVISIAAGLQLMLSTSTIASGFFDATTGQLQIINSTPTTVVYFYPARPVMNFAIYEQAEINDNDTIAFDDRFAYRYTVGWNRLGTAEWSGWTATPSMDFYSITSWRGVLSSSNVLFVVNNRMADQIKYWDNATWTTIRPTTGILVAGPVTTTYYLDTSRIIVTFKNRLICLNTTETSIDNVNVITTYHVNRARCSRNGDPTNATDSWRTDIPGRGYFIDAPTKQPIISATIIHDRLIVYFLSSTWELVYTQSESYPFIWQQINSELGAQSQNSEINFDDQALAIGATGIHSCNGSNVSRIDNQIPNDVFEILASREGTSRTCGIRDFKTEMVYWSIPIDANIVYTTNFFPNKILAYNYKTGSYAYFDDTITAWGYYEEQLSRTWGNTDTEWQHMDATWDSGDNANDPRVVIAGNQQGWTFLIEENLTKNSQSMQITDINRTTNVITCINHNLPSTCYIYIENCIGTTSLNGNIYQVTNLTENTFFIDTELVPIGPANYAGGGTITLVSQISFHTKPFNFYAKQDRTCAINKIDFLVSNTENGEIAVEYYPSFTDVYLYNQAVLSGCQLGTGNLILGPYTPGTLEDQMDMFWHPVYINGQGQSVQIELYYNREQMKDPDKAFAGFELHAMTIYATPTSFSMNP